MAWPNRGLAGRPVAMSTRGMVASANPLASQAGLRILQAGGNAIDAAIATAAAIGAAEPYMSGIAGVGVMLVHTVRDGKTRVLDYTGCAPAAATPSVFTTPAELNKGPKASLVPGAAAGWFTALEELGTLQPAVVLAPAIDLFERGIPITVNNEWCFRLARQLGGMSPEAQAVFFPEGEVPPAGSVLRQPKVAATLRRVIDEGWDSFYRGALGAEIAGSIKAQGGLLTEADLAAYHPFWSDPIAAGYRGYTAMTPPPPGAGIQILESLRLMEGWDLGALGQNSPAAIHLIAEAFRIACADRVHHAARPDSPVAGLLSDGYIDARRAEIDPAHARPGEGDRYAGSIPPGGVQPGDLATLQRYSRESTTHLDVVDAEGNAVAITQSLGAFFGSGVLAGETGLCMNNFCSWFDLHPDSPNVIAPNRPVEMCLSPTMLFRDGRFFMATGTPGSMGIMQTTPQWISNVIDHGFSIQAAIEAPRFRVYEGTILEMEARIPQEVRDELFKRGHEIRLCEDRSFLMGGAQGIMVDPDTGVLLGGADPRRDGAAVGW